MITLTYGRQKPQNGNKGQPVFDALTANIDLDDAHDHNGTNSKKLESFNFNKGTRSILSGSFTLDVPTGKYYATVAMPSGYSLNTSKPYFFCVGGDYGGREVIPTWERNPDDLNLKVWMPQPQTLTMVCG